MIRLCAGSLRLTVGFVVGAVHQHIIAGILNGLTKFSGSGYSGIVLHKGAIGSQAHTNAAYPLGVFERTFHTGHAGSTAHPLDGEISLGITHCGIWRPAPL